MNWKLKRLIALAMVFTFTLSGCATGKTKQIAIGMAAGAAVGAIVGHEFIYQGHHRELRTQNTIITAAVFALITGGVLAWHYNQMQEQQVEISGRYARFRLCNPDEQPDDLANKLGVTGSGAVQLQPGQIGRSSLSLDDNTKWVFPVFRKRYLQPDRGENQVVSDRYIWEILKPGSFVTRSQDPQFFVEEPAQKIDTKQEAKPTGGAK